MQGHLGASSKVHGASPKSLLLLPDHERTPPRPTPPRPAFCDSVVQVLSINTVIYSPHHCNSGPAFACEKDGTTEPATATLDPLGQFAWLTDQLQGARSANSRVYVLGHIPPVVSSYDRKMFWKQPFADRYGNFDIMLGPFLTRFPRRGIYSSIRRKTRRTNPGYVAKVEIQLTTGGPAWGRDEGVPYKHRTRRARFFSRKKWRTICLLVVLVE